MKGTTGKIVIKPTHRDRLELFPPTVDELLPGNHPVRIVHLIIDKVDMTPVLKKFKGGGASIYDPKMLLKVLIYGYMNNIYSSRKLERAIKEQIPFMWLAGASKPDHHTINRFRSNALNGTFKAIFAQVVHLLVDEGVLNLKEVYTDGTKIESAANKYTFVWAKTVIKNKERIVKGVNELWDYAKQIAKEEMKNVPPVEMEQVSAEKIAQTIESINKAIGDKPVSEEIKKKQRTAKAWPKLMGECLSKEQILNGRNSYSKTDPDASFMRMKEDVMGNGQLKPGYNCQISTNNQFITNYSIHQQAGDTTTLAPHLECFKQDLGVLPEVICADAGYGSEENYTLLQTLEIVPYVKYNYFEKEKSAKWIKDISKSSNFYYNKEQDFFVCPMGQKMEFVKKEYSLTKTGFEQELSIYKSINCKGCSMRGACYKGIEDVRTIEVNHKLNAFREQVKMRLQSEQGQHYLKRRGTDVESAFGNIKANYKLRRFTLRGLEKVLIEFGLHAMGQNMRKIAKIWG